MRVHVLGKLTGIPRRLNVCHRDQIRSNLLPNELLRVRVVFTTVVHDTTFVVRLQIRHAQRCRHRHGTNGRTNEFGFSVLGNAADEFRHASKKFTHFGTSGCAKRIHVPTKFPVRFLQAPLLPLSHALITHGFLILQHRHHEFVFAIHFRNRNCLLLTHLLLDFSKGGLVHFVQQRNMEGILHGLGSRVFQFRRQRFLEHFLQLFCRFLIVVLHDIRLLFCFLLDRVHEGHFLLFRGEVAIANHFQRIGIQRHRLLAIAQRSNFSSHGSFKVVLKIQQRIFFG